MPSKVAFIGLGIMGLPMAGHLLTAGHTLHVHTRTRARAGDLLARGAVWQDSPAGCARQCEVIFLCLPDAPDVQSVLLSKDGIASAGRADLVVVDHSTISPLEARRFAGELAPRNIDLVDAPVSGGDIGARNGTLAVMAGGNAKAIARAQPFMTAYARAITHCGDVGAGQFTKLVNQILVSMTLAGVCEALTFARASGLDLSTTINATSGGAAASWQLSNLGPRIAGGDYAPGFMIDLLVKDLRILQHSATGLGVRLPLLDAVRKLFETAQAEGMGRNGTQALFETISRTARSPE